MSHVLSIFYVYVVVSNSCRDGPLGRVKAPNAVRPIKVEGVTLFGPKINKFVILTVH